MNIFDWTAAWGVLLWAVVGSVAIVIVGLALSVTHRAFLSNRSDHFRTIVKIELDRLHDEQILTSSESSGT